MTAYPKRRKPAKLGVRERPQVRCPQHLKWIRGHECLVQSTNCGGQIEAAHVRGGTDGGMGVKPSDFWAVPLCRTHHAQQHRLGEQMFQAHHQIDMRAIAQALALRSPHRKRWENDE